MKIFGAEIFIYEPQISTFSSARSLTRSQVIGASSSTCECEPHEDVKSATKTDTHTECLLNKIDTSTPYIKPHYQEELKALPSEAWRRRNPEEDRSGPEKSPKKPDRVIPCPRCNSGDTKFCYFNNYNVNQPRHFCKKCQRYWTAGGTMRNVPIGAGRRKSKHHFAHYGNLYPTTPVTAGAGEEPSTSGSAMTSMTFQESDAMEKEIEQDVSQRNNWFMKLLPPPPPPPQGCSPLWVYPLWDGMLFSPSIGYPPNQTVTPMTVSFPFSSNTSSIKQQPNTPTAGSPPSSSSSGRAREGRLEEEDGPERMLGKWVRL